MATDLIRYDLLVQDALKGVVRRVLEDTRRDGLPGEHYFYITFRTKAQGVRLSDRMRERYPDEMTIVLQHQFWDLTINDHAFEVGLSFSGVAERLLIPFSALTGFFDPSVPFSVKFEIQDAPAADNASGAGNAAIALPKGGRPTVVPALAAEPSPPASLPMRRAEANKPADGKTAEGKSAEAPSPAPDEGAAVAREPAADAKVVSIDSFRKKP